MELLNRIIDSNEEEIDGIIKEAIEEADADSEKVEKLGFLEYEKFNSLFKGFIPLNTRIKYSKMGIEDYGMQTTDFMYEFAHFIKQNNITSKGVLVRALEYFINSYFGMPGKGNREDVFYDNAWEKTESDEEFFKALDNNKLGDLKHKGVAECTERGALAQQILSLFGIESYYCIGCLDLGNRQEPHCFNIVKRKNDYVILDYSCPIESFTKEGKFNARYPFVGVLSNEEFLEFVNNNTIKNFKEYEYIDGKKIYISGERLYVVGKLEIEKEKNNNEQEEK